MNKKEYTKVKETYLKHKKWCEDNLEKYKTDKAALKAMKTMGVTKPLSKEIEQIETRISIYEIFEQLVKEAEDNGLHLVTTKDN